MSAGGDAERVPDAWPPASATASKLVPLFPLPNLFLFPGTVMPLHIFEPRYRQMIEDSLDGPGRLVIGTVLEQYAHELAGCPPVHAVAGLGEIARHERLPDGRFVIMLVGLSRVQIREAPSQRLYRKVEAVPLSEIQVGAGDEQRLRKELLEAVLARTPDLRSKVDKLPADMPVGHLADLLLLRMQLPQSAMQPLYSELDVGDRARHALDEHARRPIPTEDEGDEG
jgi:Lon protease-like protein